MIKRIKIMYAGGNGQFLLHYIYYRPVCELS